MKAMAISFADLQSYVWSVKYTDGDNILKLTFVLPESISFFLENIKKLSNQLFPFYTNRQKMKANSNPCDSVILNVPFQALHIKTINFLFFRFSQPVSGV